MIRSRLIIDGPAEGAWNMAVDEALLEIAERAGRPCLRFYRWTTPTLSLGYFQKHADRRRHAASRRRPLVRRSTGGGAILHDRELTYSFTASPSRLEAVPPDQLYRVFHDSLVEALADWRVCAQLCRRPPRAAPADEPFLCFLRRADGDVLIGGAKIAGSAQRRRRRAILQHGSVLLAASPFAPELPGLEQLGARISPLDLIRRWTDRLAKQCRFDFAEDQIAPEEQERARRWEADRFANPQWTRRR